MLPFIRDELKFENEVILISQDNLMVGICKLVDKIDIKYEVKNKKKTPVIGSADSFGTKGGNKLTKSHTVSYRGKNNEELSKYGDEFTFKDRDKVPGTFYLIGNTVEETIANEEESADNDIDLASEIDNIEDEIDNPDSNEVLPDDLNFNID